ncbi:MAG: hypothetical protein HQL31_07000 [Planctomycetes bacterium]|nr:hypothetical protein [Planctomycetota bacterium]
MDLLAGSGRKWLILSSTHHPEEEQIFGLLQAGGWKQRYGQWGLLLVPRHPERTAVLRDFISRKGMDCSLYSELKTPQDAARDVILVDRIGVLKGLYSLAELCFVGGSLIPHGGQNMIEPAALGRAVLFGPHTANFREAVSLLLGEEAALQVENLERLGEELFQLLDKPSERLKLGEKARAAIRRRKGAARRVLQEICSVLED